MAKNNKKGWLDKYSNESAPVKAQTGRELALLNQGYSSDAEALASIRANQKKIAEVEGRKAAAKRTFVGQGKPSTRQSEERRKRLNQQYAASHPYASIDEQGNLSRRVYNRSMETQLGDENTTAAGVDKGLTHTLNALDAAGIAMGAGALTKAGYNAGKAALAESMESGLLSNTYKLNPWAFKPNPNAYYRGLGRTGLDDALENGFLRSSGKGNFGDDLYVSSSFDEADFYANNRLPWIIREDGTVVDDLIKGEGVDTNKYFAEIPKQNVNVTPYHINNTQFVSKDVIPIDKVKLLQKDWLRGYKEVPKPITETLPPPQQSGFTWTFNPLSYFGEKLPEGWHRKMGSGKGIRSIIENKGIVSPTNDYLFFSEGSSPIESYPGVFSTSYSSERIPNKSVSGWNRFYGPRGRHRGLTPIDQQGNPIENISLEDPALNVHRRVPFTNAYVTIPKEALINGPRTFGEKVLINPTGANVQKYAEDLAKLGIYGSMGQYIGNSIHGNEKNPTPLGEPILPMFLKKSKSLDDAIVKKLKTQKKQGGWLDKYSNGGAESRMGGLTDKGFNYNGAWGGPSMKTGGNIQPPMAGAMQTVPMAQEGKKINEDDFQKFFQTLPSNLRVDSPDYNLRGYWDALGRPAAFDYSQPKEDDGAYHGFSRHPETGEILKRPQHPTFKMAIEEDRKAGYLPIVTPDGKVKTVTGKLAMGGKFQNGGDLWSTDKKGYVDSVLTANKHLDWVQRIYDANPKAVMVPGEKYPSTHLMSDNDQGYIFPQIVNINGQLVDLGNRAEDYARETNTGIQLPVEQGTWFARSTSDKSGYKMGTGVMKGKPAMQKYKSIDKHAMGGSLSEAQKGIACPKGKCGPGRMDYEKTAVGQLIQNIGSGIGSGINAIGSEIGDLGGNVLDLFKRKKRVRRTKDNRDYVGEVFQTKQPRYDEMSSTVPLSSYLRPMNTYNPMESMNTYSEINPMGSFDFVDKFNFSNNYNPGSVVGFRNFATPTDNVVPIASKTQALDDGIVYSPEGKLRDPFSGSQLEMNYAAMGASIPGSVGFTYARTQNPAPSNGPYAKKTKASAQNGREMSYYQHGLDWKPKTISQDGSEISYDQDNLRQGFYQGLTTDPIAYQYPGRIQDPAKRDAQMQNIFFTLMDEYKDPYEVEAMMRAQNENYGSDRLENQTLSNYFGYDYNDIQPENLEKYFYNYMEAAEPFMKKQKEGGVTKAQSGTTAKQGKVIKDNNGYWNPDNWGKVVEIDSPDITMEGVNQDLIGVSDEGDVQYMEPGKNYKFKGKKVREYPMKNGGWLNKYK